ncbi:MAG: TylF/MycF/NovP-related O-methyltransferase [Pseudomonadota bacterium]
MHLDDYLSLETDFAEAFKRCAPQTMTSPERMFAVWQAVEHLSSTNVEGDIVECGVWRGGSSMMAACGLLHHKDETRQIWLYDTYEGMPDADERDRMAITGQSANEILAGQERSEDNPYWAIAQIDTVRQNMAEIGFPAARTRLIKGMVESTIPEQSPDKIALLRLDTDWYSSTYHELVHLWPKLQKGGIIIIDDYGFWQGARRAVEDYFSSRSDRPFLARIDVTGRMAVKL